MTRKKQGLRFNLEVFETIGWKKRKHFEFKEKDLLKEWAEIDRLIYQAYGIHLPENFFNPIGVEEKEKEKKHGR